MGELPSCEKCYELEKNITGLKLSLSTQIVRIKDLEDRVNSFKKNDTAKYELAVLVVMLILAVLSFTERGISGDRLDL